MFKEEPKPTNVTAQNTQAPINPKEPKRAREGKTCAAYGMRTNEWLGYLPF